MFIGSSAAADLAACVRAPDCDLRVRAARGAARGAHLRVPAARGGRQLLRLRQPHTQPSQLRHQQVRVGAHCKDKMPKIERKKKFPEKE